MTPIFFPLENTRKNIQLKYSRENITSVIILSPIIWCDTLYVRRIRYGWEGERTWVMNIYMLKIGAGNEMQKILPLKFEH